MHFRYGKTFCRLAQECEDNMLVKLSSEQSRKVIDRPVRFLPPKMVPDKANIRLQHTLHKYKRSKDFKGNIYIYRTLRIYDIRQVSKSYLISAVLTFFFTETTTYSIYNLFIIK